MRKSIAHRAAPARPPSWQCSPRWGCSASIRPFTHESIIGTLFRGRVLREVTVGDLPAIVPEIEGSAYITGEITFLLDSHDPLRYGFRL